MNEIINEIINTLTSLGGLNLLMALIWSTRLKSNKHSAKWIVAHILLAILLFTPKIIEIVQ